MCDCTDHKDEIPAYDAQAIESKWMKKWDEENLFAVDTDPNKPKKYVLEMFPYPSGDLHMGHARNYTIGDAMARQARMRGYDVLRKAGWDTHGLPVELEVEKMLGLDGKEQIEEYGVEPFIQQCKESVWKYEKEWRLILSRLDSTVPDFIPITLPATEAVYLGPAISSEDATRLMNYAKKLRTSKGKPVPVYQMDVNWSSHNYNFTPQLIR